MREAIEAYRCRLDENPLYLEGAMGFEEGTGQENLHLRAKAALARYLGGRPEEIETALRAIRELAG